MVDRAGVHLVTPGRLDTDEGQAKAQAGDHHPPVAEHRVLLRCAPARQHRLAVGFGQGLEQRQVVGHGQALLAGALVEAVQVVADPAQQLLDQLGAAGRQFGRQRIAFGVQCLEDVQRRRRGVQAHAVADAPVPGRVVGQYQGHAFVAVVQAPQFDPAPGQFGDEIHAFGLAAIADHVRLAALAAPGQVLEADGPADDAPVQFRQGDVHGQVPRPQALLAVTPARFVVLGADRLDHRDIAAERPQVRGFGAGLGEACGVEDHPGRGFIQPVFHLAQAARFLEAGHRYRQGVEARRQQALAEQVDKAGVGRLQVGAVEQQRRHGLPRLPVGLPVTEGSLAFVRVVDRRAWQGLRFAPGVVAPQQAAGQAAVEIQRVVTPALAQELPQAVAFAGSTVLKSLSSGSGRSSPGTRINCTPRLDSSTNCSTP